MYVTVKAAEGRRVWAGQARLSNDIWQHVELTGDLVKAIRNGDVIEGTPEDGGDEAAPKIKESLDAAREAAEREREARTEEEGAAESGVPTRSTTETPSPN